LSDNYRKPSLILNKIITCSSCRDPFDCDKEDCDICKEDFNESRTSTLDHNMCSSCLIDYDQFCNSFNHRYDNNVIWFLLWIFFPVILGAYYGFKC